MPLVGQHHDVRCMTTIVVTSSVPEFLFAVNLLMQ
jgi:ABC-type microcin C transport system permease subunit YejB